MLKHAILKYQAKREKGSNGELVEFLLQNIRSGNLLFCPHRMIHVI